jgi:two-component system response regulator DevR
MDIEDSQKAQKQLETEGGDSGPVVRTAVGANDDGKKQRMVVCDRNELIREGLKTFFTNWDIDVVGEAGNEVDAWEAITQAHPGWIVLDLDTPEGSGLNFCKRIRTSSPNAKLIIYTDSFYATKFSHRLCRSGVHAILLKTSPYAYWSYALQQLEETWLDPQLLELVNRWPATQSVLTVIEAQVLVRITERDQEIAEELDLHIGVVVETVKSLMMKLKSATRNATALKAMAFGNIMLPKMQTRYELTNKTIDETAAEANALKVLGR